MKIWASRLPCFAVLLAIGCIGAEAATLEHVHGKVLVNRGDGFQPVTGPVELRAGDLVMVDKKSSAIVTYGGGCGKRVSSDTVFRLEEHSDCDLFKEKNGPALPHDPAGTAAGSVAGPGGAGAVDGAVAAAGIGEISTTTIAIGVGVGIVVGAGILISRDSPNSP